MSLQLGTSRQPDTSDAAGRAVRHLSLMAVGRLSTQAVLVVAALAIPRSLGAEEFGRYASVVAIVVMLEVVGSGGLHLAEVRFFAPAWRADPRQAVVIGSSLWTARLMLSALVALAGGVLLGVSPAVSNSAIVVAAAVLLGVRSALEATRQLFLSLGRVGTLAAFEFARAVVTFVVVVATFGPFGLGGVFVTLAAAHAALLTLAVLVLRHHAPISIAKFDWKVLRPMLGFGGMTLIGMAAWIVQAQAPVYAVANWASLTNAAVLGITVQVYVLGQTLLLSPWTALMPILAELDASGQQERLREWGSVMMRWSTALAVLACLGWALTGGIVLSALPESFAPAHVSGTIVMASVVLLSSTVATNGLLYASGFAGTASGSQVAFAAVTVAGAAVVVTSGTADIARSLAWIYVASSAVFAGLAYLAVVVRKSMRLPLRRTGLIALPVVLAWPAQTWEAGVVVKLIAFAVFAAAYAAANLSLGLLPARELRQVVHAAKSHSASS